MGHGGGGGNKGHRTYIDRRECIFLLNRPYSAHKLGKEDIVFLSYAGDSRCILYDARSDDDRTPFLFLSLFLRNTPEEPELRRNNTDASRRAASDSKRILRVSRVSQFGGEAANDCNGSEESFRILSSAV
jgi:hypothetical protein